MTSVLGALLGDGELALLGAGVLMAIGWWDRLPTLSRIGPAVFAGIAAGAIALPPLLYLGVAPTPIVGGALAVCALAAGLALRRRRAPAVRDETGGGIWAALAVAGLLAPFAVRALVEPVVKFDAYADWQLKARLIYGHGGLVLGALNPHALDASYLPGHREYPLGFPATTALVFHVAGGASARVAHAQALVIFLAFAATAWALLRPRVSPLYLAGALCLLASASSLHYQVLSTYADVPLAAFWSLAACAFAIWVADARPEWLALGTLLAAAALATKQEGIPLGAALLAVTALALVVARTPGRLCGLAASALAVAASALPWQLEIRAHHLHDADIDPSLSRMARQTGTLPVIAHRLLAEMCGVRWPGILPLAVLVALMLVARGDRLALAYLLLLALSTLALVSIYWNARIAVGPLLTESAERVVTAPLFLSVLALPSLLGRLVQRGSSAPEPQAVLPSVAEPSAPALV